MARNVYTYQFYNETPDKPLGILLPFNKDAGGSRSDSSAYNSQPGAGKGVFKSSYTIEQQAMSNLKNLILTQKGERLYQPEFGTDIQRSLFENNTKELIVELQESLNEDIKFWLPYIIIEELRVFQNIDQHQIVLTLSFKVSERGANQLITVFASSDGIVVQEENVEQQSTTPVANNIGGGY